MNVCLLFKEIAEWRHKTFGFQKSIEPTIYHLQDEITEILKDPKDIYEYADAMMLLIDAAHISGYNYDELIQAVKEKFEICKKRKWGEPDENGVVHHIEEEINTKVVNQ